MRWIGYAWLTAAGMVIVAAVIYGALILRDMQQAWAERERVSDEEREESRQKHPTSRPTGPEDSPNWKEWASSE